MRREKSFVTLVILEIYASSLARVNEAFCLSASMYSGLKPNSIYYIGSGLGYYNLASGTVRSFDPPSGKPLLVHYPYWLHPTNPIA
ncbi:unnamed protein product [Brassica oleracea var. botrytis]|uniref:Uncharacterized protein n=2 Tax=Brassica TaxID=3705 RepID=A0A0D3ALF6_BRAOL|nr:hypothetical protein Bca52824_051616 [Brassica carinata]